MRKVHYDILKDVVIQNIYSFYHGDAIKAREDMDYIKKQYACGETLLRRLEKRLLRMEIQNIMIRDVLRRLPEEKQKFMELKYEKGKSLVAISMRLNISPAQLAVIHKDIVSELKEMMSYKIDLDDVFTPSKILTMYRIAEMQLKFLDNEKPEKIRFKTIRNLRVYQMRLNFSEEEKPEKARLRTIRDAFLCIYQAVIRTLTPERLTRKAANTKYKILRMKFEYPHQNVSEIAAKCNVTSSNASMYLTSFKEEIARLPEAKNVLNLKR